MHLETIKHLRGLAVAYDDLVPIAKPLLLELLDSYEESATVSESALELVHTDMQGQIYGAEVIMHECAADDFATWFQHFKSHTITGTRVDQFDIHSVLDIMVEWIKAPFSLELPTASKPPQYLIISDERRTHGMVWFYAPDSKGYTVCTARAGRFTEAEAAAILAGTSGELSAMRESNLPKLQILHHIDRGYGDNGAILKTLITHALPTTESQPVNTVNPVIPVPAPETFEAVPEPPLTATSLKILHKPDHDTAWESHFILPLASFMQKRGCQSVFVTVRDGQVGYEVTPVGQSPLLYELVDATDEERYSPASILLDYPLGLFTNFATALRNATEHHPGRWEPVMDQSAFAEIRARKLGTSGGDYAVLWRGEWFYDYEAREWKLVEQQTGTLEKPLPITRA